MFHLLRIRLKGISPQTNDELKLGRASPGSREEVYRLYIYSSHYLQWIWKQILNMMTLMFHYFWHPHIGGPCINIFCKVHPMYEHRSNFIFRVIIHVFINCMYNCLSTEPILYKLSVLLLWRLSISVRDLDLTAIINTYLNLATLLDYVSLVQTTTNNTVTFISNRRLIWQLFQLTRGKRQRHTKLDVTLTSSRGLLTNI